jgi:ribonuclease P protein component
LRVGLTVTRKVGHASERNRIKRRLRTAVQEAALAYRDEDLDIVLIGRRDILAADYRILIDDLRRALRAVTRPKDVRTGPHSQTEGERRGTSHA